MVRTFNEQIHQDEHKIKNADADYKQMIPRKNLTGTKQQIEPNQDDRNKDPEKEYCSSIYQEICYPPNDKDTRNQD